MIHGHKMLNELFEVKTHIEENSSNQVFFALRFDSDGEIHFDWTISRGWNVIDEGKKFFNACDVNTNIYLLRNLLKAIKAKHVVKIK